MTTEFNPLIASDTGAGSPTTKCTPSNRGTEPTLKEMTDKAISLLQGNPKGFVLQVEGASIDKRDHSADACGQIGELLGMDDAIGVAQEFQRTHPDTLILVTADHSHTSQIIPVSQVPRGAYTTLQTVDGQPIRIAYGTGPGRRQPGPHGLHGPGLRLRPARRRHRRHDRPDRAVPGPHQHPDLADGGSRRRPRRRRRRRQRPGHALADHRAGPATFAPFVPGVEKDYTASLVANVISSAADATLSVADPSSIATGRLVNGTFSLAQAARRPRRAPARSRRSAAAPRRRPC